MTMKRPIASLVVSSAKGVMAGMRTARHKVLGVVALAAVGLVGTGAVVVVGQDRNPAAPGRPVADLVPAGEPDDPAPTAFPGIKRLNSEGVAKFFAARLPLVRASADDPATVRLNKAKLRLAIQAIHYNFELSVSGRFDDRVLLDMSRAVHNATDSAAVLWPATDDRRPWLEMLVGVQLEMEEQVMARARAGAGKKLDAGPLLNRDVTVAQSARMDAELALLNLGQKK
jgi:hypothetical protein